MSQQIVTQYPKLLRVQQKLRGPVVDDVEQTIDRQLAGIEISSRISPGQSVAITAGSRGIHQLDRILRAVVMWLRKHHAEPFIVPAMGSHGGGTAEGQLRVLERLGITESSVGCPIRATMETVEVCQARQGFPVHFDRYAYQADHVFVVNRIKPHTNFTGSIQSGLMKMMLIGLGKHVGAQIYHSAILDHEFGQIVRSVASEVMQRCQILGGLAIVENGLDQTAVLRAARPAQFEEVEIELLEQAEQWLARLPFQEIDLLIVDRIGKDVSGAGMDTNVIGRKANDHVAMNDERPDIRYIFVRGLTEATHGNATGIGLAEFTLQRVVKTIDPVSTATNCITSNHPTAGMLPIALQTDRDVLNAALTSIGLRDSVDARMVWIKNTLQLEEFFATPALLPEIEQAETLQVISTATDVPLQADGNLADIWNPT